MLSVEHFRQFLYGQKFQVWRDHQPLKYLLNIKEPAARLVRWMNRLNMYDYEIKYKKGIKNGDADALSRLPAKPDQDENTTDDDPIIINYIVAEHEPLNDEQLQDENLKWFFELKTQAAKENKHVIVPKTFENQEQRSLFGQWNRIHIIQNRLYRAWTFRKRNDRVVNFQYIVPHSQRLEIMRMAHDSITSGHLGTEKTCTRIAERFYWPAWETEVKNYVISCE